jgi:hypothetical protein
MAREHGFNLREAARRKLWLTVARSNLSPRSTRGSTKRA